MGELCRRSISAMVVSHDSTFLDSVAQDMVHYEKNRKLKLYKGNLTEFVKRVPEAAAYYKLESDNIAFSFPDPGMLEGVTSRTKALIKMSGCTFAYPGCKAPVLRDVSVQVSLASRVAVIGPNGAGKSTLIKLLVGEIVSSADGSRPRLEKHPNMRLAYVAQHAFHHIEHHLDKTPISYLEWRFGSGVDEEGIAALTLTLDEDEALLVGQKAGQVDKLVGRRKSKKDFEYCVQLVGCKDPVHDNEWVAREEMLRLKWTDPDDKKKRERDCGSAMAKLIGRMDERCAFEQSGVSEKKLTAADIQAHFDHFDLEAQFGTFAKIAALSGGQKVKVVLAAAMWMEPHVLVLDEPTNFLDRDSLGALATAIKNYAGGCIIISHQREFYSALCPEVWSVVDGKCTVSGSEWMDAAEKARKKAEKEAAKTAVIGKEDKFDAFGNKITEKQVAKKIPKSELKKLKKRVADERKKGKEVWTDEELEKEGWEIPL
uniref:ABC transporter domain-containing protein n=1 Tax=Haptolina ericina TaxID=156174 RepID=A0A7S3B1M5_9EUKA